ncbi:MULTISPECIES: ABC transporter permease [Marinobacter]|uniref:Transport permease protein n=1 Tax=Marinobacter xestospongiae TaxID=994319 RepID=A0ABU3VZ90_9GAMM|nr:MULTISPECIES: ABC transporter permease [Marinobacter]MCG8519711.1 ABC transporter permease [Pseudomonadales bacterium]MCK7565808.1 ABC transporter permease [Marinobacter xestospongiae]MDV2079277.1 ABC transporter permease [Marinobacter xestospongiae]UDL03533.1 ABC transporter permease [Marinobacter sp. CA1]
MSPSAILVAFNTILVREIRRFTRIWAQTLLPPAVTMTLYFIIFGNLIGSRIGEMGGFDYMAYIVPGLIMMAVITNSYSNVVSSFFSMKFQRSIEELLVSPVPNWVILTGYVAGGMARGLSIGVIVTMLSLAFTQLEIHHVAVTMLTVVLTSALFALGGFINAMLATKFDDISIVPTFVLTPLTYLGGVFYSIQLLPEFWQAVSMVNPILYMVNAFRYGILGVSDVNVVFALSMILVFIAILFTVALQMLKRGKGIRH